MQIASTSIKFVEPLYASSTVNVSSSLTVAGTSGLATTTATHITASASSTFAASTTILGEVLPNISVNSILATDGNHNVVATTTSGGASPSGSNGNIQYYNGGSLGATSTVSVNSSTPEIIVGNNLGSYQYASTSYSSSTSITDNYTGATTSYVTSFLVPSNAVDVTHTITFVAKGTAGLQGSTSTIYGGLGGNGAIATGTLSGIMSSSTYYIGVGLLNGGLGGGGSYIGGPGGFGTWVSTSTSFNTSTVLLVAAGGGGGGGGNSTGNSGGGGGGGGGDGGGGGGGGGSGTIQPGGSGGTLGTGQGGNGGAPGSSGSSGTGGAGGGTGGGGTSVGNATNGNGSVNGNGGGTTGGTGSTSGTNTAGGGGMATTSMSCDGASNGGGCGAIGDGNGGGGGGAGSNYLSSSFSTATSSYTNSATGPSAASVIIAESISYYLYTTSTPAQKYGLSVQNGIFYAASSTPTISSCGTNPIVSGGDASFVVTPGTGSPTSCTVTFYTSKDHANCSLPVVIGASNSSTASSWVSSENGTTITLGFNVSPSSFGEHCDFY